MSHNPFTADPAVPQRLAQLGTETAGKVRQAARGALVDGVLPRDAVEAIRRRFALASVRELMLVLLDLAKQGARPSISDFHVGAVGLESETGNLVLGGNVEFPGTQLGFTLHGEGFVFTRAMSRGTNISVIAIDEAHPCAHCRQCLAEYARSDRLELIDPLGHTLTLAQLYPWPFDPSHLGERGAVPGRESWPNLKLLEGADHPLAAQLLAAGRRSHSPYSQCPGAVVLSLADGSHVSGLAIESVAYNPTIQPIQAAMVELIAHGHGYEAISGAVLGTVIGGAVDYARGTAELLARVAPDAPLTIVGWSA
ncbi:MAG: hypothetical protein ABS76_10455 [Pelagibacterium sp. SCN 64-44]|nr:MAG: hypothetical protein ABS76_10455 [Pelagibacterium sp. SCN 64-44]